MSDNRVEEEAFREESVACARELWNAYLLGQKESDKAVIASALDETEFSMIGTGRHEFYARVDQFVESLVGDREESEDIAFEILDEYYEGRVITADVCLVFGTLWVREVPSKAKALLVEMDTRFSILFRKTADGIRFVHLHHSTPNYDQRVDEYYPKTATEQANAALEYSKELERRADLDSMTGLYNRMAFERLVDERLARGLPDGVLYMIDLDNFKGVNDSLGHLAGDKVIIEFARVLRETFLRDSIIGRVGGDEFAVLACDRTAAEESEAAAARLIERWAACREGGALPLGCSIGMAKVGALRDFRALYCAADEALYESKRAGKGRFSWYG